MSEHTTTSRFPLVALPAVDRLKHFAKDGPTVRVGPLFFDRVPAILGAFTTAAAVVLAWWIKLH